MPWALPSHCRILRESLGAAPSAGHRWLTTLEFTTAGVKTRKISLISQMHVTSPRPTLVTGGLMSPAAPHAPARVRITNRHPQVHSIKRRNRGSLDAEGSRSANILLVPRSHTDCHPLQVGGATESRPTHWRLSTGHSSNLRCRFSGQNNSISYFIAIKT